MTLKRTICNTLAAAGWLYFLLLFAWTAGYLLVGDDWVFLALVNLGAVYLFFPLPLVPFIAVICKRRSLWLGIAGGAAVFIWLWGGLFSPARWLPARSNGPTLRVMTYNVLAYHNFTRAVADTIHNEDPDVVFIQELNHALADHLRAELSDVYPYQALEPVNDATGIGTISKFPLQPMNVGLEGRWIGGPQVLKMDWQGQTLTLVNIHLSSTHDLSSVEEIRRTFRRREIEAHSLADFARRTEALIMAGDANAVFLNQSHTILTEVLIDSWAEAGFGLGHTFPGSALPGSDRPRIGPIYSPKWLARIDYVFHSPHWQIVDAHIALFDGVSDHRAVVADLQLKP